MLNFLFFLVSKVRCKERFGVLNGILVGKRERIVLETLKQKFKGAWLCVLCVQWSQEISFLHPDIFHVILHKDSIFLKLSGNGLLDWISVLDMKRNSAGALELLSVAGIVALHGIIHAFSFK